MAIDNSLSILTIINIQRDYFALLASHSNSAIEMHCNAMQHYDNANYKTLIAPGQESGIIVQMQSGLSLKAEDYKLRQAIDEITMFWKVNGNKLLNALKDHPGFCISDNREGITPKSTIPYLQYFDSVCVEDAFFSEAAYYYLNGIKLGPFHYNYLRGKFASLLALKPFCDADTDDPMIIIYPSPLWLKYIIDNELTGKKERDEKIKKKVAIFFNEILGNDLSYQERESSFSKKVSANDENKLSNNATIMEMAYNKDVKLMAINYIISTNLNLLDKLHKLGLDEIPSNIFALALLGAVSNKIIQHQRIIEFSAMSNSDPLLDHFSWPIYKWSIDNSAGSIARKFDIPDEYAAIKLIQSPNLKWLANANLEDIIELRNNYNMAEVRKFFTTNRKLIKTSSLSTLENNMDKISYDMNEILDDYAKRQEEILKKRAAKKVATWTSFFLSASLSIASLAMPASTILAMTALAASIAAGSSILNIIEEHVTGVKIRKELSSRPIGFFLHIRDKGI